MVPELPDDIPENTALYSPSASADFNSSVLQDGNPLEKTPTDSAIGDILGNRVPSDHPTENAKPCYIPESIGHSRLDGEIARGGMGIILKGRDTDLDRDIAIKVLHAVHQHKPEIRRRFMQEARITAKLQHPGIVPIYELGQFPDSRPYFAMRLVNGQTLKQLLGERCSLSDDFPRFLKIFEQVCQAMAYAHSCGVIHRDLKPANVMIAPFGVVQVMDWGVAKVLFQPEDAGPLGSPFDSAGTTETVPDHSSGEYDSDEDHTQIGIVMGTPAYMPPEQARGEIDRLDTATDVFGLGAILCEILTGEPPYVGKSAQHIYRMAVKAELSEAHQRLDNCEIRPLASLAKSCISAEAGRRPHDAAIVSAAITDYLESDLRRAQIDLVRFFELSLDMFCIAGFDGFFHRVNANFSRVLGHSDKELMSRPFLYFVHPEDVEKTTTVMTRLSDGEPIVRFRNRYRDNRDNYHLIEWTSKAIPEENIIFAVARDVSESV